jgi:hypothetical protein
LREKNGSFVGCLTELGYAVCQKVWFALPADDGPGKFAHFCQYYGQGSHGS